MYDMNKKWINSLLGYCFIMVCISFGIIIGLALFRLYTNQDLIFLIVFIFLASSYLILLIGISLKAKYQKLQKGE